MVLVTCAGCCCGNPNPPSIDNKTSVTIYLQVFSMKKITGTEVNKHSLQLNLFTTAQNEHIVEA